MGCLLLASASIFGGSATGPVSGTNCVVSSQRPPGPGPILNQPAVVSDHFLHRTNEFQLRPPTNTLPQLNNARQANKSASREKRSLQPPLALPAKDGFAPVRIEQLRQPLPSNQVWLVKTVLLNPEKGTLTDPGGWAAPAKLLSLEAGGK